MAKHPGFWVILELIDKLLEVQIWQYVALYVGNFIDGMCIKYVYNVKFYFQFYWYELHLIKNMML